MNANVFTVAANSTVTGNDLEKYRNKFPRSILTSKDPTYENMDVTGAASECLCKSVTPLIKLAQLFGIIPLVNDAIHGHSESTAVGKQGQGQRGQNCIFTFRFSSLPNLTNYLFFAIYTFALIWCYMYYRDTLVNDFQGTDLYAHEFKVNTTIVAGVAIMLVFRFKYGSFIKCIRILSSVWSTLNGVGGNINNLEDLDSDAASSSWRSRLLSPGIISILGASLICINVFLAGLGSSFRFSARYSILDSPTLYIVQVFALTGLTGLQQCVSFTFAMLCWITKSLFIKLSLQLKHELGGTSAGGGGGKISGNKLEQIRLLHNALCNSNKYLSSYFGLPVLGICCTGVIAITCGIYNFIFSEETLFDGNLDEEMSIKKLYYVMFCFEMYFAVLAIGLILLSGQMLSNSVSSCIDAIHECNLVDLDEKSEFQVMVCLQSIKASSGKLTANNMATIGMGFIASAVTNTTTYILVLLQFRLGGSDDSKAAVAIADVITTAAGNNSTFVGPN